MGEAQIDRRTMLRTLALGFGALTFGRIVTACTQPAAPLPPRPGKDETEEDDLVAATDQDEHVPGKSPPVQVEQPSKFPQQVWEARVRQLEDEQSRVYARATFTRADPGIWKGKENSHEPRAAIVMFGGNKQVQVTVEHVMGTNKPDSGAPAPQAPAPAPAADAGAPDAARPADGGGSMDAGDASAPVEAGTPPPAHYITTIYVRAMVDGRDTVIGLHEFASTDPAPPTANFEIPEGVTSVVAYEWCTLHGLWASAPLAV